MDLPLSHIIQIQYQSKCLDNQSRSEILQPSKIRICDVISWHKDKNSVQFVDINRLMWHSCSRTSEIWIIYIQFPISNSVYTV